MDTSDMPEEVHAALARGRDAYVRGDIAAAEAADQEALTLAEARGSARGAVRARRFLGLCAYRRGDNIASAARLEAAQAAAAAIGWEAEELLVLNHLGATYRKMSRLDDADRVFRNGLERANPRQHLVARARLLANYGAFLDDLGDERAAADHYARYEELLSLVDDPGRLANARGLVSRAARLRGDLPTALAKARDEVRLGAQVGSPLREGRGWMHLAQAHAAVGNTTDAEAAFLRADELLATAGDTRAPISVAHARGRFFLEQHRIHDAFEQVARATEALAQLASVEHEHRAKVSELAAGVAAAAGLHGEALWHIGNALESQLARFEPIADPRLLPYTRARRRALVELAEKLLKETDAVERGPDETRRVAELLARLSTDRPKPLPSPETVDVWRTRIRNEAEVRWRRLLTEHFDHLPDPTRRDLILADVVSAGPVGDLSRSMLLLFTMIEREIRERLFDPLKALVGAPSRRTRGGSMLHRLLTQRRPCGLGDMVDALLETPNGWPEDDARVHLERRLATSGQLDGLRVLREPVLDVEGTSLPVPTTWRNDVAHGRPWSASRAQGDAVRRVLTIGAAAPLRVVVGISAR